MTLKNLLINTEKPTHILSCKIAWRLRSAICILISFICILWGPNSFGQEFRRLLDDALYPTEYGPIIDPTSNKAVLYFVHKPQTGGDYIITEAMILPQYQYSSGWTPSTYGYYKDNNDDTRSWLLVCDAETVYTRTSYLSSILNKGVYEVLQSKGLGSVVERRNFITLSKSGISVSPVDFRGYIQPWIISGLVIAILIPAWYLCRRFLRG